MCSFSTGWLCRRLCVCCVQPNSFVFVSRCTKSFGGQLEYVFWCSCDPKRAQLADCLPSINTESFQTFEQQLPPCHHIMAARIVLEEIDGIHDISPSLEFAGMPCLYFIVQVFLDGSREIFRTFVVLDEHRCLNRGAEGATAPPILAIALPILAVLCQNVEHKMCHKVE